MELQDSRFVKFMLNFWVDCQKFRGASRICAAFINFFLLIFKLTVCGIILVIYAPHLLANSLLNKQELSLSQKILYTLSVLISMVIDIPLLTVCIGGILVTLRAMIDGRAIEALLLGFLTWRLIKMELTLVTSLFYKSVVEESTNEEEVKTDEPEPIQEEEVKEELPFCQLFDLSKDTCLLVDHVEMCPDETAFIRVVDEEGYTSLYKRKVKRNRVGDRFIVFNDNNYYLDDKKTQPIIPKK